MAYAIIGGLFVVTLLTRCSCRLQRVVADQRLMQSASDIFLGWTKGASGRHFHIRQLRDAKICVIVEGFDLDLMQTYARLCAWALARAPARSGDPAMIAGYERDYRGFVRAVKEGRIQATADI